MLDLAKFQFQPGKLHNNKVIFILFQYGKDLVRQVKKLSASWNPSTKSWHLPDQQHIRSLLNLPTKPSGKIALHQIHAVTAESTAFATLRLFLKMPCKKHV
jgi:hypothetical protein